VVTQPQTTQQSTDRIARLKARELSIPRVKLSPDIQEDIISRTEHTL